MTCSQCQHVYVWLYVILNDDLLIIERLVKDILGYDTLSGNEVRKVEWREEKEQIK